MQQVQQREVSERISWARAMIFAVGFFFIAAILIGQLPSYIFIQVTASSLVGFEEGSLSLGVVCLAGFAIIQVIVLLFDPKPLVPPTIFVGLGAILSVLGLALAALVTATGCTPDKAKDVTLVTCNQFFPLESTSWHPILGGDVLWFQPKAVDFVMIGLAILGVGAAMVFYGTLALREQKNPDRRDLGTTPAIRWMLAIATLLLIVFLFAYAFINDVSLGTGLIPGHPYIGYRIVEFGIDIILGAAVFLGLGAFALRLHYLMRPIRKTAMSGLYAVGALGLAQLGVILILAWFIIYPLIAWMHTWTFIGLGSFLTLCTKPKVVPGSCSFTQDAGYLVDAVVTMGFFTLMMAGVWGWRSHRNLVVITSVVITAVLAFTALLMHTAPDQLVVAMILAVSILVLVSLWTMISRSEFAVIGENNLGCLGMWLVVGTCLFIYIAAFGFFSIPSFADETEPNIPFAAGTGFFTTGGGLTAIGIVLVLGILAGVQFYFLVRNRYKA